MTVRIVFVYLCLLPSLLLGHATVASAQDLPPLDVNVRQPASIDDQVNAGGDAALRSSLSRQPVAGLGRSCCNPRGAIIGAAIGAGLGALLALSCDAGDCTSASLKGMALLGGVGGAIGAFTDQRPARPWPSRRVGVSVLAVPKTLRASARVTF
jgi:hypothetical protein